MSLQGPKGTPFTDSIGRLKKGVPPFQASIAILLHAGLCSQGHRPATGQVDHGRPDAVVT